MEVNSMFYICRFFTWDGRNRHLYFFINLSCKFHISVLIFKSKNLQAQEGVGELLTVDFHEKISKHFAPSLVNVLEKRVNFLENLISHSMDHR